MASFSSISSVGGIEMVLEFLHDSAPSPCAFGCRQPAQSFIESLPQEYLVPRWELLVSCF